MEIGSWSSVTNTPVFAVHGALVYNPISDKWKVMLFGGGAEANNPPTGASDLRKSHLWDPDTGTFSSQAFTLIDATDDSDPFCAHQCQLPDGRLLVMGGSFYGGPDGQGIRTTWVFDPASESWSRVGDMAYARWYPTSVLMPDGRVLVASGRITNAPVSQMEMFDPATNAWSTLPSGADKSMDIYPSLHLVPAGPHAGKVFYTGTRWAGSSGKNAWAAPQTALFDPASNIWQDLDAHSTRNRTEGFSLLLPPAECARYLVLGGGQTASDGDPNSAEVIDLMRPSPQWADVKDMVHDRTNVTGVILPNGTVFVFGGHGDYKWDANLNGDQHVYICEIFDPTTRGWMETAPMARPRQYHSVGVLLPDGRVLCAGGVFPNTTQVNQQNMEIFSPPYMDEVNRPVITATSASVAYGGTFQVDTPQSAAIDGVVLIRPLSITHHTDSEQRYVRLSFRVLNAGTLEVSAPGNPNLAPPGYYMLFLVDACGVPSVAKFVHVGPPVKVKEVKDIKEKEFKEFKEKEFKEFKEKELKELKEFKEKELKELKEKELKEFKEKDKDIFEGGDIKTPLTHFIQAELRPNLTGAVFAREPNIRVPEPVDADPALPAVESTRPEGQDVLPRRRGRNRGR